jgi:hypothetical protein
MLSVSARTSTLGAGLLAFQRAAQGIDDRVGDLALHGEDVVELAVVGLRPQVAVVHRVDELRGDAHLVAGLAHAAFEDVADLSARRRSASRRSPCP